MASRYVGVSVRRFEDAALLRGEARYLDDLRLPGTLAVAFLRAPRLHEDLPDNVLLHTRFDNGRLREVAGAADLRLSASLRHPRCSAAPLENRGVIAYLDRPDGALTVWASTQAPHLLRTGLAEA